LISDWTQVAVIAQELGAQLLKSLSDLGQLLIMKRTIGLESLLQLEQTKGQIVGLQRFHGTLPPCCGFRTDDLVGQGAARSEPQV
jgi:hypothetical protein